MSRRIGNEVARGVAAALGAALCLDVLRAAVSPAPRLPRSWLDGFGLPPFDAVAVPAALGVLLLVWALRPAAGRWRRSATLALIAIAIVVSLVDAATVARLIAQGTIASAAPFPLSLAVLAALAWLFGEVRRTGVGATRPDLARANGARPLLFRSAAAAGALVTLALLQMLCFGRTSYARPADAVIVFGARAYADGTPSLALADRVRTGAALVKAGLAPVLVVSGGPADGQVHEANVMRDFAVRLGVPRQRVLLDYGGVTTEATAQQTARLLGPHARVLAVSHGYHLPRVKLAFEAAGPRAYTVPAKETRPLSRMPWFVTREVAAYWIYAVVATVRSG